MNRQICISSSTLLAITLIVSVRLLSVVECLDKDRYVADVILLVDNSRSIDIKDFAIIKDAMKRLTDQVVIRHDRVQAGFIDYSDGADVRLNLTGNATVYVDAVDKFEKTYFGATFADKAYSLAQIMFADWGRNDVRRVTILLTDGVSTAETKAEARVEELVRDYNATIYVLYTGRVDTTVSTHMGTMAGADERLYMISDYSRFLEAFKNITIQMIRDDLCDRCQSTGDCPPECPTRRPRTPATITEPGNLNNSTPLPSGKPNGESSRSTTEPEIKPKPQTTSETTTKTATTTTEEVLNPFNVSGVNGMPLDAASNEDPDYLLNRKDRGSPWLIILLILVGVTSALVSGAIVFLVVRYREKLESEQQNDQLAGTGVEPKGQSPSSSGQVGKKLKSDSKTSEVSCPTGKPKQRSSLKTSTGSSVKNIDRSLQVSLKDYYHNRSISNKSSDSALKKRNSKSAEVAKDKSKSKSIQKIK